MDIDKSPTMAALDLATPHNLTETSELSNFLIPFRDPRIEYQNNLDRNPAENMILDDGPSSDGDTSSQYFL
jgi:hypothetical protein